MTVKIYTSLDNLFDTTMTIIGSLDPRLTNEYMLSDGSNNGVSYLSDDTIKYYLKKRNEDTLRDSLPSSIIYVISDIIRNNVVDSLTGTSDKNIKINLVVNTYPYNSDRDFNNAIREILMRHNQLIDKVDIIREEFLSKEFLENTSIIIDRYGIDWLMKMKIKDPSLSIPNTTLMISDVFLKKKNKEKNHSINKFSEYVRASMMLTIKLEFIDEDLFKVKV